jgi:3-methyl-2-oxobutanoate hydroxymethyltransferase
VYGLHLRTMQSGTGEEMSLTETRDAMRPMSVAKVTPQTLLQSKQGATPLTALTAYDYPTARLVDEAGIDVLLVGDSLGMAVLGYENTLSVTMDDMLHHARAVRRGTQRAMLVVDMPYGSYQVSVEETLRNALRLVKEAGSEAVKLEGGVSQVGRVQALTEAEIPVVGHIGLTPQSLYRMGGYHVQGRSEAAAAQLREDALALEQAGAVALVLEGIPRELAAQITGLLTIPTIGIGAGPDCDGQILVFHDLFSLSFTKRAKFVRPFGDARELMQHGLASFRDAVTSRAFPDDAESYHMPSGISLDIEERAVMGEQEHVVCG